MCRHRELAAAFRQGVWAGVEAGFAFQSGPRMSSPSDSTRPHTDLRQALSAGLTIPAMPLALDAGRHLDERRQRALVRYYAAAGAGGLAVGVHTTQFAIRDPKVGLFEPLLRLARE